MAKIKGASLEQAMPAQSKADTDYETEDNMRTMHSAAAIAADPTKLKKVHKLAGRRHKALTGMIEPMLQKPIRSLDDLKKKAYSKQSDPDDAEDF